MTQLLSTAPGGRGVAVDSSAPPAPVERPPGRSAAPGFDLRAVVDASAGRSTDLIGEHVNPSFAKVLKILGFDVKYARGQGAYLWDEAGRQYIDCLAGFGVFACGRNHPVIRQALADAMAMDLPNLPKMGPARLSGALARELVKIATPGLDTVYFCNSGAEGVETAIKYARAATGRNRILFCRKAYHGLTLGSLSLNGGAEFRDGFGPLLEDVTQIPFNDLSALELELQKGDVAGFVVEPIQGKGVIMPDAGYLPGAVQLCHAHGALFVADEVQTGYGRTGRVWAVEHWLGGSGDQGAWPDVLVTAKALSGGYVPVGAVLTRRWIHQKVFSSLDRCMVHSTTFGQNDLAMAAGLATLHVLREQQLTENAARVGQRLLDGLTALRDKYEMVKDVRGKGLMVALEFGPPRSLGLKMGWNLLHAVDKGLFPQAVLMPLLKDHGILAQVAGHQQDVIKLIPPLVMSEADADAVIQAFDTTIAAVHRFPGPAWEIGKRLSKQALGKE